MNELITWLRAQLDEDERVARQVMAEPGGFYLEAETDDTNIMTVGAHVYRWTPKRVLAEVDAKRRIVDFAEVGLIVQDDYDPAQTAVAEDCKQLLRLLALPYADRPGYREEWRP